MSIDLIWSLQRIIACEAVGKSMEQAGAKEAERERKYRCNGDEEFFVLPGATLR